MKKILYALLATASGLILLFSYRTSLDAVPPTTALQASTTPTTTTTAPAPAAGASEPATPAPEAGGSGGGSSQSTTSAPGGRAGSSSGLHDGTYTGASANTRYGAVQVQISVSNGQISDVQVVDYPQSNSRDAAINQRAIPALVSETTQAQSANISMISGATYTSSGYLQSLQSAIDQAGS
jgi:uncharacterized protein with FMN-binding domain